MTPPNRMLQVQVGFRLAQWEALTAEAHRRRSSVAAVVRDAVERYFALPLEQRSDEPAADERQTTLDDAAVTKKRGARKGGRK